jgi:dinuclear metal center YbgI/SA1388 family protein
MKLRDLIYIIDSFAPFAVQKDYDNSGIQCGDLDSEVNKILLALDATVEVVDEAVKINANTILTHHPPLFFPQKRIVKSEMQGFFKAISNGINVVSTHTNFDLATNGLNDYFCKLIQLKKLKPIIKSNEKTYKLAVYVPEEFRDSVANALFEAGAGHIGNYSETSFNIQGIGSFKPLEGAHPFLGASGKREYVQEVKVETVVRERNLHNVIESIKKNHPYEEPAYDIYEIISDASDGVGAVGELENEMPLLDFAKLLKEKTKATYIRLIGNKDRKIKKVAVCTGAGSSLIKDVKRLNVDLFLTGDLNYHQALDLKESLVDTIEIEHFDTEKFFVSAMYDNLSRYIDKKIIFKSVLMKSPFEII